MSDPQPTAIPMITERKLVNLFPRAGSLDLQAILKGEAVMKAAGLLGNANRLAMFLAQTGHESAGFTRRVENLNYSAARLCAVWPSRFASEAAAQAYAHNPSKLADQVYGGRMGNTRPGDGFRYRGRGYIQLTGREAYRAVGALVDQPFEENPDLVAQPAGALLAACGYWTHRRLNLLCDQGDIRKVTSVINGGLNGLDDRRALFALAKALISG